MSTWAAFAVKGAAVVGTTSAGAGIGQAFPPGALDGFAVGTLLTGMCFLVVVAPRTFRRARLSARRGRWPATMRHARVRREYYAAPADTHSLATAPDAVVPAADAVVPADEARAPQLSLDFADPALEVFAPAAGQDHGGQDHGGQDHGGQDHAGHAGADPYAPETFAPAATFAPETFAPAATFAPETFAPAATFKPYATAAPGTAAARASAVLPGTSAPLARPAAMDSPVEYAAADAFGADGDDIVLPGYDDPQRQPGRRGYRSKHRLTGQETGDRRPEARRGPPRHAAPSGRLSGRMPGRLSLLPLVPARG